MSTTTFEAPQVLSVAEALAAALQEILTPAERVLLETSPDQESWASRAQVALANKDALAIRARAAELRTFHYGFQASAESKKWLYDLRLSLDAPPTY